MCCRMLIFPSGCEGRGRGDCPSPSIPLFSQRRRTRTSVGLFLDFKSFPYGGIFIQMEEEVLLVRLQIHHVLENPLELIRHLPKPPCLGITALSTPCHFLNCYFCRVLFSFVNLQSRCFICCSRSAKFATSNRNSFHLTRQDSPPILQALGRILSATWTARRINLRIPTHAGSVIMMDLR
jgi:hypothetical protein